MFAAAGRGCSVSRTIRQQTQLRSSLVRTAERGLPKPAQLPVKRQPPRPLDFIIDGTACTDDALVARFPRSTREAFGHHIAEPAPRRVTFLQTTHSGWAGIVAAVLVLSFFIWGIK